MRLSEIAQLESFALFGPGFTGDDWLLVSPLVLGASGTEVVFVPYENTVDEAIRFGGPVRRGALTLDVEPMPLEPVLDETDHAASVESIRADIAAGDVYQVNLTMRARLPTVPGERVFATLCRRGVPRFAAWMRLPDGREIASASPELFFAIDGRTVRTEPMKGTASPDAAGQLATSPKDRAELAMITDLLRNDLVPVCVPRSVRVVNERRFIELPYAIQAVSDVEGTLRAGVDAAAVLHALHPGGSITGAPKQAAMDRIARLERSPRGAYCGALGLVEGGRATFSLLIRTAEKTETGWRYGVGGGIVWDSTPSAELAEARLKLGALR